MSNRDRLKRIVGGLFAPYAPGFATQQETITTARKPGGYGGYNVGKILKYVVATAAVGGAALGAAILVNNVRDNAGNRPPSNVERTVPTPVIVSQPTIAPNNIIQVTPETIPTVVQPVVQAPIEPFKLQCSRCSPAQLDSFSKIAKADYEHVLRVYGISEEDAELAIGVGEKGWGATFRYNGNEANTANTGFLDFTEDPEDRGLKHELAHAINHTSFLTYHSWFDEGLAMYASGEINTFLENGMLQRLEKMRNDPSYWNEFKDAHPGHTIGSHVFGSLAGEYGMTEEQNRTALSILQNKRHPLTRNDIQDAFQTALGTHIDTFDAVAPGIKSLYRRGYENSEKIGEEF